MPFTHYLSGEIFKNNNRLNSNHSTMINYKIHFEIKCKIYDPLLVLKISERLSFWSIHNKPFCKLKGHYYILSLKGKINKKLLKKE